MKKIIVIAAIFSFLLPASQALATTEKKSNTAGNSHPSFCRADSLHVKIRVGYNLGGTSPIPLPASIRSIDAFRPTLSPSVGADIQFPIPLPGSKRDTACNPSGANPRFSISAGLRLENKGMDIDATVKSYRMEMTKGNSQISGLFSGHISQQVTQWMLTVPINFQFSISNFQFSFGPFFSLLFSKNFSGIASSGYLRQGDPTGPKIDIGDKEGEWATYDFSPSMRSLQWGLSLSLDWNATPRLGLFASLSWGLSGIFNSDFTTVQQSLYPIYGSLGLFYNL